MISRRKFVANVAATTAAVTIVPRHVLGKGFVAPSDRLNIAGIGVGGMGRTNLLNLGLDNNIVALATSIGDTPARSGPPRRLPARLKREEERLLKTDLTPESRKNSEHRVGVAEAHRDRGSAEDQALHRLSPDVRAAEGHRRDRRRDARSHARADRDGGARSREARLRAEAAVLVG